MNNSRAKVSKEELEKAYATVALIEEELAKETVAAREVFFTGLEKNLGDLPVPKFNRGTTMSQAFRMGSSAGAIAVFEELDQIGALVTDGSERMLNVIMGDHGPDIESFTVLWANHINT